MAITIRTLHAGHEEILLGKVAEDVFDEAIRPELVAEFLAEPRFHICVALDGDTVVGVATGLVHMHPDKGPEFFVNEVGVAAAYHRRGIGTRLMAAIFAEAKAAGCAVAWLGTENDNAAALGLYRSVMRAGTTSNRCRCSRSTSDDFRTWAVVVLQRDAQTGPRFECIC